MNLLPKPLRVTILQAPLEWQDAPANLSYFNQKISSLDTQSDVIVLPEMFTTGFTMKPQQFAELHEGPGFQWMKQKASEKSCVICGSISVNDNGKFFNRLYWVRPDGTYEHYDKRHLFRMAGEDKIYTAGTRRVVVELKGWKILLQICYDLRFPVFSRNRWNKEKDNAAEYDAIVYVANWPQVRSYPWKHLLIARAIENQAYVVGVNRIGNDGNKIAHSGDSVVLNPRGEQISTLISGEEKTETVVLDYTLLDEYRKAFPVGLDAD
jgi:omega-amidase